MSTPALLHPSIPRVEPAALGEALRNAINDQSTKRPLIVDVRDPGTTGGFIRGAISVPKVEFDDDVKLDAFVDRVKSEREVIFHCFGSNKRGPTAAFLFLTRLEEHIPDGDHKPAVKVLRGGFQEFAQLYAEDEALVDPRPLDNY